LVVVVQNQDSIIDRLLCTNLTYLGRLGYLPQCRFDNPRAGVVVGSGCMQLQFHLKVPGDNVFWTVGVLSVDDQAIQDNGGWEEMDELRQACLDEMLVQRIVVHTQMP
jgi:hypothetical protein